MFVILISSISLASEDPVDEDSFRNFYLGIADYFFTAIFTFEVCLKVRGDKEIRAFSLTIYGLPKMKLEELNYVNEL